MTPGPPPQAPPPALLSAHTETLRRLVAEGFEVVQFLYFESHVGVRKHGCAALLAPQPNGSFQLAAAPTVLVEGHLSARVERGGEEWFVWKAHQVRATHELRNALRRFEEELRALLEVPPVV